MVEQLANRGRAPLLVLPIIASMAVQKTPRRLRHGSKRMRDLATALARPPSRRLWRRLSLLNSAEFNQEVCEGAVTLEWPLMAQSRGAGSGRPLPQSEANRTYR